MLPSTRGSLARSVTWLDGAKTDRPRVGSLSCEVEGVSAKALGENDTLPLPANCVMAWLATDTAPLPPRKTWR